MTIKKMVQSIFHLGRKIRSKNRHEVFALPGGKYIHKTKVKEGDVYDPFKRNTRIRKRLEEICRQGHKREVWSVILGELQSHRKQISDMRVSDRGAPIFHVLQIMEDAPYYPFRNEVAKLLNWEEILFEPTADRSNIIRILNTLQKIGGISEIPLIESAYEKVKRKGYSHMIESWLWLSSGRQKEKIIKNGIARHSKLDREAFLETIEQCKLPMKLRRK